MARFNETGASPRAGPCIPRYATARFKRTGLGRYVRGLSSAVVKAVRRDPRAVRFFCPDVAWIGDVALAGANIGHGEPMLPAISEVVNVI